MSWTAASRFKAAKDNLAAMRRHANTIGRFAAFQETKKQKEPATFFAPISAVGNNDPRRVSGFVQRNQWQRAPPFSPGYALPFCALLPKRD